MTWEETYNGILKGIGKRPTRFLLRWTPTLKHPFGFDLVEVMRCESDGDVMTYKKASHPLGLHAMHRVKSPGRFSFWELFLVQMRVIR